MHCSYCANSCSKGGVKSFRLETQFINKLSQSPSSWTLLFWPVMMCLRIALSLKMLLKNVFIIWNALIVIYYYNQPEHITLTQTNVTLGVQPTDVRRRKRPSWTINQFKGKHFGIEIYLLALHWISRHSNNLYLELPRHITFAKRQNS